jgi:hypothetical protein
MPRPLWKNTRSAWKSGKVLASVDRMRKEIEDAFEDWRFMKRGLILVISFSLLTGCDQMGGSRGDSGGMGSQTDKAFERGSGSVQKGPKDADYRSGAAASGPGQTAKPSNPPGSPSGGTAGWPDKTAGASTNGGQGAEPSR